jgi:hypothetical protein
MAPGSVRAALMGCVAIIVAAGGMILDKDQYDKVSRINRVRSGDLHLSPYAPTFRHAERFNKIEAICKPNSRLFFSSFLFEK